MKIIFKKLRYKNIMSTGNNFTEIDFLRHRNTLISGRNGGGKSTAIESLVFALYGKPFRKINKPQLINSVNGSGLLVEVEFSIANTEYLVRRGIKPNLFEIVKDGKLLNQDAASRDYQDMLEKQILKISYKSFTQIVILGSASYTPFMDLTTPARREIIEDLLDIQVFSTMNVLMKDKVSSNKEAIKDATNQLEVMNLKVNSAKDKKDALAKVQGEELGRIKAKSSEAYDLLLSKQSEVASVTEAMESLYETIADKDAIRQKIDKLKELRTALNNKKTTLNGDISFYEDHDDCPTCKQALDAAFKAHTVASKTQMVAEVGDGLEALGERLVKLEDRLSDIAAVETQIRAHSATISGLQGELSFVKQTLRQYKKELEEAENKVVDTTDIGALVSQRDSVEEELQQLHKDRELLGYASLILKDTGIKSKIIKKFIPVMNKLINKYLAQFELFVDFQLDENFNETILSRYRDAFSYSSFSEGEKMRINLAILMAWRAISRMRNSVVTNILFLDEILDGASDSAGVESLIQILHGITDDSNVFVISHRGETFADKFEGHIHFEKVKNFSEYSILA